MTPKTATILIAGLLAVGAAPAQAKHGDNNGNKFEGRVVSVNRDARSFRMRDSQRGTVTIKVTGSTRFQRVGGFAGLRAGMTRIEANVRRSNGAWVATFVERSGGGGGHGGSDG